MEAQMAQPETLAIPVVARRKGRPKGSLNKSKRAQQASSYQSEMLKIIVPGNINIEPNNINNRLQAFFGDVPGLQEKEIPKLRIEALGFGGKALRLLMDFVLGKDEGGQEAPAAIRRLAALDILNIAGITTTSQTIIKQPASNKPVAELSADELRALLASQKTALEQINDGLGRVVNE
jgi:hypothetical protein